jgi:serine/threonine protein phosphatase PrpC
VTVAWRAAGATHVGRVRETNQDSFRVDADAGIFLVADGMGGHAAGEVASRIAADFVLQALRDATAAPDNDFESAIHEAFVGARQELLDCCEDDPRTRGMGTTVIVAVLRRSGRMFIGHLGDSRLYRYSGGALSRLTTDHTWIQREIDAGRLRPADARGHRMAHVLLRVLSGDEPADPDVISTRVAPGDILLLCSDGLCNLVDDRAIGEFLRNIASPEATVAALIAEANRRGGTDNVTAVVVHIE